MDLPIQTSDIFKLLSKGQFISSNSSNKAICELFNVMDNEETFEALRKYFSHINFVLEKGDEYFYFSRAETKSDLENKIERAYKWIDIVDFLKTYDNAFGLGSRFSLSDILVKIKTDAELESKLEALSKSKETQQEILEKEIIKPLLDDTFIDLANDRTGEYKVLAAFKYIEQLIMIINISEDVNYEIPE